MKTVQVTLRKYAHKVSYVVKMEKCVYPCKPHFFLYKSSGVQVGIYITDMFS